MSDNMGSRANRLMKAIMKEPKRVTIIRPFGEGTSTYRHAAAPRTRSTAAADNNNEWGNQGFSFSSDEEEGDDQGNGAGAGVGVEVGRKVECRICHEEDHATNMEAPCACNGSLKLAHRRCIQQWCNEKKDTICEICHQPYQAGYTVRQDETVIDINDSPNYDQNNGNGSPNVTRVLTIAEAEGMLAVDHYDECGTAAGIRVALVRSVVLLSGAFMMMKHAFSEIDEEDHSFGNILSIFFLRVMAFLMPIYILCWIANLIIRRSERREAATRLAARHNARMAAAATIAQRRSMVMQPPQQQQYHSESDDEDKHES